MYIVAGILSKEFFFFIFQTQVMCTNLSDSYKITVWTLCGFWKRNHWMLSL